MKATVFSIPKDVVQINDFAFKNITFTDIYYDGLENDWSKIFIGVNNDCLFNATKHFAPAKENDNEISKFLEYDFQTMAGVNSYGEIFFPHFETSEGARAQVYSMIIRKNMLLWIWQPVNY